MATESVEILIEAEDLASGKFKTAAQNAESSIKRVKEVGERAKKSTEFFGSLANSLGGTAIGSFAGQLAGLTEKTTQFSEVAKTGTAGALAFKAGIVAAAASAGLSLGKMLGEQIYNLSAFSKQIKTTADNVVRATNGMAEALNRDIRFKTQEIELIKDPEAKKQAYSGLIKKLEADMESLAGVIAKSQAEVAEFDGSISGMLGLPGADKAATDAIRGRIAAEQKMLEGLRSQRDELANVNSERARGIEALKEEQSIKSKSDDYLKGLREEVELLSARKEDIAAIEASRNTTGDDARAEAERLIRQRDAIREMNDAAKKAEDEKQRAAERSLSLQQATIDKLEEQRIALNEGADAARVFSLEKQGINKLDALKIVSNENEIKRLSDEERRREQERDKADAAILAKEQEKINEAERIRDLQNTEVQQVSAVESRTLTVGRGRQNHLEMIAKHLPWILRELTKSSKTQETIADNTESSGREEIVKLEMQT
jgi:DNA repair exonuclease SbcCD ATPase subunit